MWQDRPQNTLDALTTLSQDDPQKTREEFLSNKYGAKCSLYQTVTILH